MSDSKNPKSTQGMPIKPVLIFTILLLALYLGIRILFLGWNFVHFRQFTGVEIYTAFMCGLRFDSAVVIPLVYLFLLVLLIPIKSMRFLLAVALTLGHGLLLLGNFVDIELVNFMGRRFTKSTLFLAGEGQTGSLLQYTFLASMTVLGLSLFFILSYWGLGKINSSLHKAAFKNKLILMLSLLPMVVIAARGGLQYKPISFVDAKILPQPYSHHLILNTSFTFLKSFGKGSFQKEKHFSPNQLLDYLNPAQTTRKKKAPNASGYNLVIFIVESLSKEYLSPQRTPFLTSLMKEGVYFDKAYANGRRSIEGIASILAGIPALMDEPFLNSEFATNEFVGLGQLFKKQNYHTSFFHGATNGTMRFDVFTKASGFDHYFGKNEFPDQSLNDGFWGIYDEPFLQFACQNMTQFPQPFASVVFTLSSHQPYKFPSDFPVRDEKIPILKTIQYVDFSLEKYMACAQKQPWFEKTIFVFVADHTGPATDEDNSNFEQKFEIPILFYSKNIEILDGLDTDQYAQQIDLLPTFNDLFKLRLGYTNHLARTLFHKGPKTIALYTDSHYELVGDTEKNENYLKAIKQYFSEGLYDNRLYFPQ